MKLTELLEATSNKLYHISNDNNLIINPDHDFHQGQLGRGFYVTKDIKSWKDSLGVRRYIYSVDSKPLKIAFDAPALYSNEFVNWAIDKGYMKKIIIKKPSGETVYELDNVTPMIRPELTDLGKTFIWQDPMTGQQLNDLRNEYLKDHGYNAYEPTYSPDGHQIIIFDLSVIKLKLLK